MEYSQRLELKNQALLEKISTLTSEYENRVADLRVEVTVLSTELQQMRDQQAAAEDADVEPSEEG